MGGLSWFDLILGKPLDLQIQFILGSMRQKLVPKKLKHPGTTTQEECGVFFCLFVFSCRFSFSSNQGNACTQLKLDRRQRTQTKIPSS